MPWQKLILGVFLSGLWLGSTGVVHAADQLLFADTFQWFGLSGWQESYNAQLDDPTLPCRTRTTDRVQWEMLAGQAHLNIDGGVPCRVVLQPRQTIPLPNKWKLSFTFTPLTAQADYNWIIKWQDAGNYLGFHIFNNTIFAEKVVGGVPHAVTPELTWFSFRWNEPHQVEITYDERAREIRLVINNQQVQVFHEDASAPGVTGFPGLAGSVGAGKSSSEVMYDDYRIWDVNSSDTLFLNVPLLKQTDSRWANDEYDSAIEWSPENPKFKRWGCALTSASMVLRFFGLDTLPNGEELTPGTLNTWLKQEVDGYLGEGQLNWRALSRLSQELEVIHGTPALEFRYEPIPNDPLVWLQTQLWRGLPDILAQPDHFVVAHGYDSATKVISIRDPFYSYQTLAPYHNTWLSARVFNPSHTDLSAISIWTEPGVALTLNGQRIWPILEPLPTPAWVYDFPQPSSGTYAFSLANAALTSRSVQLVLYQSDGQVEVLPAWSVPAQTSEYSVELNFSTHQSAIVWRPDVVFSLLPTPELLVLLKRDQVRSPFIVQQYLQQQYNLQQADTLEEAQAILQTAQEQLSVWQENDWLNPHTKTVLENNLQQYVQDRWP